MKKNIQVTAMLFSACLFLFHIAAFAQTACPGKVDVWPGDADNNGIVDNNDLLPIGLFYGSAGIPRDSISNLFQSDSAANWGLYQVNLSDIKHADCNGDSTINADDTLAMNLNFNLTRPVFIVENPSDNFTRTLTSASLYIKTSDSLYNAGDWVNAEIWIGDNVMPADKLYGIAFQINYDALLVEPGTELLSYPASWLGIPGAATLKFARAADSNSIIYGAITRFDLVNARGFGKIADLKFQIRRNLTDIIDLNLSFLNYMANDSAGEALTFDPYGKTLHLNTTVGINELQSTDGFNMAPNPFTSSAVIHFAEMQNNSILTIRDVLGKTLKEIKFSGMETAIEKGGMKPGVYFLQVVNSTGRIFNKKIAVE